MPGETISPGELASLYHFQTAKDKWPDYHITIYSKTARTDGAEKGSQLRKAMSNKFNVLLSDKKEDSGHEDHVVVGMKWGHYNQIKDYYREMANDPNVDTSAFSGKTEITRTETAPMTGRDVCEQMPVTEAPEE